MTYDIVLITDSQRSVGFGLAGISGIYKADDSQEAMDLVEKLVGQQNIGIIMISDHLVPSGDEFERISRRSFPTIVTIPSYRGSGKQDSRLQLREFIQRSIGISIEI